MTKISYAGYRFPPEIILQTVWLYVRFTLSFRDVEDLLTERDIMVSYETVRRWVNHFGPKIAADLRKRRPRRPSCAGDKCRRKGGRVRLYRHGERDAGGSQATGHRCDRDAMDLGRCYAPP
jgi:transposase-like protein